MLFESLLQAFDVSDVKAMRDVTLATKPMTSAMLIGLLLLNELDLRITCQKIVPQSTRRYRERNDGRSEEVGRSAEAEAEAGQVLN